MNGLGRVRGGDLDLTQIPVYRTCHFTLQLINQVKRMQKKKCVSGLGLSERNAMSQEEKRRGMALGRKRGRLEGGWPSGGRRGVALGMRRRWPVRLKGGTDEGGGHRMRREDGW